MTNDLRKLVEEVEKATINTKDSAIEVVDTLEDAIGSDAIGNKEIPLLLRPRLRWQDATVEEKEVSLVCNNY